MVWNINRGQSGVNGSARTACPFTLECNTYSGTFVLNGVSVMVKTAESTDTVLSASVGGFLSCGLPASSAMSGLTVSMHLVYPRWIPQYILFEILTEARPGSFAMSGLTVSMHLVYPSGIPQYILFEILTEARAGWTGQPAGAPRSVPSELRTPAH